MNYKKDYYTILGITPAAETTSIRAAYMVLSEKYHPEKFWGSKEFAKDMMSDLNEAYEVLSNSEKRAEYDLNRNASTPQNSVNPAMDPISDTPPTYTINKTTPDNLQNLGAWRRFFARTLDLFIYEIVICAMLIWLTPYSLISELGTGARVWLFLGVNAIAICLLESLIFSFFGNTVGKSILGISIANKAGKKLEFGDYFERAFSANFRGLAFGTPLVGIITQLIAKSRLEEKGETLWDEKLNFKVTLTPISATRVGLYLLVFLIVAMGNSLAMLSYKSSFIQSAQQLSLSNTVAISSTESQPTAPLADAPSTSTQAENATKDAKEQYKIGLTAYKKHDYAKALYWYKKSADQGLAEAQNSLGDMYSQVAMPGVPHDNGKAADWYRKAAEQGYAEAQKSLGVSYEYGYGMPEDISQAVSWYRKSSEQGNAHGQNALACLYDRGKGVPKDAEKAFTLFRKAAEQGYVYSQYSLALKYATGSGVHQDYMRALMWSELTMTSDDVLKFAYKSTRDELPSHLSQAQFNEAIEMAKACRAKKFQNCD